MIQSVFEPTPAKGWRIAVVEDDARLLDALGTSIGTSSRVDAIELYPNAEALLARGRWSEIDLAIIDLGLPGMGGLELIGELLMRSPSLKTAVFTINECRNGVAEAVQAGACGYLLKTSGLDALLAGIEAMISGHILFSPEVVRNALAGSERVTNDAQEWLSPREEQVLGMLQKGMLRKEIARGLGVGHETVNTHVKRLYSRLGANGRREALAKARQLGLV